MDPLCCESKSWKETTNVENLSKGPSQPFYQALVDVSGDPELLVHTLQKNILHKLKYQRKADLITPYIEFLFFGEDTAGDFILIKQLRGRYNQPCYEASEDEDDDDGSQDS